MVFLPFLPSRRQFAFVSPDLPVSRVSTGWQEKAAFKTHLCAEKGWHHTHWRYWPIYWNPSAVINHPADHTHTHTHTHSRDYQAERKKKRGISLRIVAVLYSNSTVIEKPRSTEVWRKKTCLWFILRVTPPPLRKVVEVTKCVWWKGSTATETTRNRDPFEMVCYLHRDNAITDNY